MGRRECKAKAIHCELISIHHMQNYIHNKATKKIKPMGYDLYKDRDYWGMNNIWFKNILGFIQC